MNNKYYVDKEHNGFNKAAYLQVLRFPFHHILLITIIISVAGACSHFELEIPSDTEELKVDNELLKTKSDSCTYYYYFDEKILLTERKDILLLKFIDKPERDQFLQEIIDGISSFKEFQTQKGRALFDKDNISDLLIIQSSSGESIQDNLLEDLQNRPEVVHSAFLTEYQGVLTAETNEFAVKLHRTSDYSRMEELANQYDCQVFQRELFEPDIYFICRTKTSPQSTVKLASIFYETGLFAFTSPDFYLFDALLLPDPFYSLQWGLNNTGQYSTPGIDISAEAAWSITQGDSDIVIAVLDDGVEVHPDLSANLLTGYNAINNTTGGTPAYNSYHGTAVAGIIGAVRNNNLGIAGVAPECKVLPVRIGDSVGITYSYAVSGMNWAVNQGADVINCSWGVGSPSSLLTNAINNATTQGRNGKGCVVVASSGNDGGSVLYPASLSKVIAVGAITYTGVRKTTTTPDWQYWWASNYGSNLNVVAPGVRIMTTDRQGSNGYNPNLIDNNHFTSDWSDQDYTGNFGGTSAAAPHVSGVAALVLSEYPDLTQEQVKRAIELGCTKLSGYGYSMDDEYPAGSKNNEVGYGLVDAYGSLLRAAQIHQQNVLDTTAGIDFIITNNSSYTLNNTYVGLSGIISGALTTLISCVPGGIESGHYAGYPAYRGETLYANPGTSITNVSLELYCDLNYSGNLRIGVALDNPSPTNYYSFSFAAGNSYQLNLPNTTVPNGCRRRLYITILNPIN